ncbi:MAG: dihydrodipicolinate synthase family protein [Eubacteriales bacterium]|nr:dihydrodipicolinate synthase family protein [Eubacteriales bacterium]
MNAAYITPAITLFDENGGLDLSSNGALYENLLQKGIDGVLVLGSIGEFFAMPLAMRRELADYAISVMKRRTRLLIGTGSMNAEEIVPFSNECLKKGADAIILISPYYFPLDNEAIYQYFHGLIPQIEGKVYLYNFPDRTGYSIAPEVVLRLKQSHDNIVGIKDTIPGMGHTRELIKLLKPYYPDFEIYSGFDDNLTANVLSGGNGCIAGLSNFYPEACVACAEALRQGDLAAIVKGQRRIEQLFEIYSIGSNFIPIIKEAAKQRGIVKSTRCTFPLPQVTLEQSRKVGELLERIQMA